MRTDDSFPCLVVFTNTGIEVAEEELVRLWSSGDKGFQFFIELLLDVVGVGHGRSVGADESSGSPPAQGELEFHKAIIHAFWNAVELLGEVIFDGKTDACLTSVFTAAATPEKGVAAADLS